MYCTRCGTQYNDGCGFCPNCGEPNTSGNQNMNNSQNMNNNNSYNYNSYNNYGGQNVDPRQNWNNTYGGGFGPGRHNIIRRDIVMCVILSIITCGIYGIYWFICMVDDLNALVGDPTAPSGVKVFLLSLVTCSIYMIYWMYKAGEKINYLKSRSGYPVSSDTAILYMVLCLFGFGIVVYCLLQSELNKYANVVN